MNATETAALTVAVTVMVPGELRAAEFFGYAELAPRFFFQDRPGNRRPDHWSAGGELKFEHSWLDGRHVIAASLFGRLDSEDRERNHWDIRQLNWVGARGMFEFEAGVGKVYWGVTESQHLVDVINQTDLVENFDGEQKLGQPLLRASILGGLGDLHFFYLPFFRERTFPGRNGRPRTEPPVVTHRAIYETPLERWHPSAAVRWEHAVAVADVGLSYFYGISRDPLLFAKDGGLVAHYPLIHQVALDLQVTVDALLLKHESVYRRYAANDGPQPDFYAQTTGFEYTLYGLLGDVDVGLLAEYLWASEFNFLSPFDNDIFSGLRLGFNDTEDTQILVGGIVDLDTGTTFANLEASRRITDHLKGVLEARYFNASSKSFLFSFDRDSYIQIQLRHSF